MSARRHAPGVEGPGAPGFLHDDPEFPQLLRIVREQAPLDVEFVEKDYWVKPLKAGARIEWSRKWVPKDTTNTK